MSHPRLTDFTVYNVFMSTETAETYGWFMPETMNMAKCHHQQSFNPPVENGAEIFYFPGSFGEFHEGHISVVEQIRRDNPDAVIVISPSHSSYAALKYGAWSKRASNKYRYDNIMRAITGRGWYNVIIDTAPMLAALCDHNFPDLAIGFMERNNLDGIPNIVVGKDRVKWLELNEFTDEIKMVYVDDTTGVSTSDSEAATRVRKHAIVRAQTVAEGRLFVEHFADQYLTMRVLLIEDEIADVMRRFVHGEDTRNLITICKDYSHVMPYYKLSRQFDTPLSDPVMPEIPEFFKGVTVVDSDIYTGTTADAVREAGGNLQAIMDVSDSTRDIEIIDVDDFKKADFNYPAYDLSERCSMQAFDSKMYYRVENFKRELKELRNA